MTSAIVTIVGFALLRYRATTDVPGMFATNPFGVEAFVVDGRGFDPAAAGQGIGVQGMADRLDAIGGELTIVSTPGNGTTISGRVPTAERPS